MNKNVVYGLLLVILGGYYGYSEFLPKLAAMDVEIEKLLEQIAEAEATAPRLPELQAQEEELKKKLDVSLSRLPSGAEIADLYGLIEPIMTKVQISSGQIGGKNIGREVVSPSGIYRSHPISYSNITGVSFSTIVRLLHELRTFDRIINVQSISFGQDPAGKYTISALTLETYSYVEVDAEP